LFHNYSDNDFKSYNNIKRLQSKFYIITSYHKQLQAFRKLLVIAGDHTEMSPYQGMVPIPKDTAITPLLLQVTMHVSISEFLASNLTVALIIYKPAFLDVSKGDMYNHEH